jgi:predicted flap endonuclease-1-like 5' DNA nuclease
MIVRSCVHIANNESIREEFEMSGLMCCLWWFLAGILLGWILNWLFDKFFRRGGGSGGATTHHTSYAAPTPAPAPAPAPVAAPAVATGASLAAAALAFGYKIKSPNGYDNFEIIEGIGPKINSVLHAANVHTFDQLAKMDIPSISKILDAAGPNFKLANPESWSAQSALCAKGSWETLKKMQDELIAGVSLKDDNA